MFSLPRHRAVALVAPVLLLAGCSSKSGREPSARSAGIGDAAAGGAADNDAEFACRRVGKVGALALPEASGAVYVPAAGDVPAHLLVVADSGNDGDYVELDADSGAVLASGQLPLDADASDDLEGLSAVGGIVYAITSSGWMRHWRRRPEGGYNLIEPAYPVASGGESASPGARAGRPRGPGLVCSDAHKVNCGSNYEGMCLRQDEVADGECAGFAAAKETGLLHCLVRGKSGRLAVDPARSIPVAPAHVLTGCHFAPEGDLLWAGNNAFGGNAVYRIRGWKQPEKARIERLVGIGSGFSEAIAVAPGHAIFRFSDTGGAPSLFDKFICE